MSNPDEIIQNPEEEDMQFYGNDEGTAASENNNDIYNEEEQFNENDQYYVADSTNDDSPMLIISSIEEDFDYQYFTNINFCRAFYLDFKFNDPIGTKIDFTIPSAILPLSICAVNEFWLSDDLIECTFELDTGNPWNTNPYFINITNPIFGKIFPGSILIQNRVNNFFKPDYKPQSTYKCQSYILAPQTDISPPKDLISKLIEEGYTEQKSIKALRFCQNNLDKARDYLISGIIESNSFPLPVNYNDSPLFYLILEICEAFFDMPYCCCICGSKMGVFSLKPFCCNEEKCQHSFHKLSVGVSVVGEIKRDQLSADLIISLASCACFAPPNPPVFDPSPEKAGLKFTPDFFRQLPSMKIIVSRCNDDSDLIALIGLETFKILRFLILSNEAQLISLSTKMHVKIPNFNGFQFLATYVSPESELKFRSKKEKYGVKWFWHGSRTERWYRILHTGLKDYGNTKYQLHAGPIYGDGIYMSESFNYSFWYCLPAENYYYKSALPKKMTIISLTENAAVPELVGPVTDHEFTQRDEEACITRVLLVMDTNRTSNQQIQYDTLANPPKVPSLRDVLNDMIKRIH